MPTVPAWLMNKMNASCTLQEKAARQAKGALKAAGLLFEYQEVLFDSTDYATFPYMTLAKIMMAMELAGWGGKKGFGRWTFDEEGEGPDEFLRWYSSTTSRYLFWRDCEPFWRDAELIQNNPARMNDSWYKGALVAIEAIHNCTDCTQIEEDIKSILSSKKMMDNLNINLAVKQVRVELDTDTGEIELLNRAPLKKIKEYQFNPTTHAAFMLLKKERPIDWNELYQKVYEDFVLEMKDKEVEDPEEKEFEFYVGEDKDRWFEEVEQVATVILIWQRFESLCQEAVARKMKELYPHISDMVEEETLRYIECYTSTHEMIVEVVLEESL